MAGQKSGLVHAVDPDNQGELMWSMRVGQGGTNGGVQWGSATDGKNVYVALADLGRVVVPFSLSYRCGSQARRRHVRAESG